MYLDCYGLNREPFHITPDPDFLFLGSSHKEALAAIIYGIQQRKGFIAVTGEVGLGKTTIVRTFLQRYDPERIKTVLVFNANVSFHGLLRVIYQELGLSPPSDEPFEMVQHLHSVLIEEYRAGWNVVLIIDEAQNMPVETLENLRMLSNLESTKDKLIQIALIGQPELEAILARRELRQLRQRIAIRTTLKPLRPSESLDYITHRLSLAGRTKDEPLFSKSALRLVVKYAQGIPRRINILCDNALVTGFGYGRKTISAKIVREVIGDLEGKRKRRFGWAAGSAILLASLAVAVIFWSPYGKAWRRVVGERFAEWIGPQEDAAKPNAMGVPDSGAESHQRDGLHDTLPMLIKPIPPAKVGPSSPHIFPKTFETAEPLSASPPPADPANPKSVLGLDGADRFPFESWPNPPFLGWSGGDAGIGHQMESENRAPRQSAEVFTFPAETERELPPPDPNKIIDWLLERKKEDQGGG